MLELRGPVKPDRVPLGKPDLRIAFGIRSGRRLLCRACGEPITTQSHRIPIEGRSDHRRTNPAGVEFEFGCFEGAPGVLVVGDPTTEHSWFVGYAWSFAICRACGTHLGWFFEGRQPAFYGLILSQLVEEESESREPH